MPWGRKINGQKWSEQLPFNHLAATAEVGSKQPLAVHGMHDGKTGLWIHLSYID